MAKYFILFFFLLASVISNGQLIIKDTLKPSFEWIIPVVDFPFMVDAAQSEANRRINGTATSSAKIKLSDYAGFYRNLSMDNVTDMSHNLHGTLYYANNLLWYKWMRPTTTKRYILNRLLANITALGTDYLATKLPYGYAFQHEEFHRSVMSVRGIYSYDEVWKFGKGFDIAVTSVKDEDLIYLKKNYAADQIRLSAAGVEGEYAYFKRMREDNFFKNTGYPFVGLTILGTFHAVNYVNLPFDKKFNAITDSILSIDKNNILARDFTGYDFSAWVYDLQRPDEPYENRGQWPGGIGIKRPIKESDLTPEMKKFLRETGNMRYLNFVTPFIIGINKLRINDELNLNFALRSVPASFGYFAGGDFFIESKKRKVLLSLGINKSNYLVLPDIEFKYFDLKSKRSKKLSADVKVAAWLQPKDQLFYAKKSTPGLFLNIQPNYNISKNIVLAGDIGYKTKGWLFGNPYQDNNFSGRIRLKISTN